MLIKLSEIDSTNLYAERLIKEGKITENTAIVANKQTNGVGKLGVKWVAPEGNLNFTAVLKDIPLNVLSLLSLYTANIVKKEILKHIDSSSCCLCKWPNDILINDKKICGILIQTCTYNEVLYTIVGIGVNLLSSPNISSYETTSILEESSISVNNVDFAQSLYSSLLDSLEKLQTNHSQIIEEWNKNAYGLNKEVEVIKSDNSTLIGEFIGINPKNGYMIIKDKENKKQEVISCQKIKVLK